MPKNRSNKAWGRLSRWIAAKQGQDICVILQQTLFRGRYHLILLPVSERSELQIPIETWLIWSIDTRLFIEQLRLVTEDIGLPVLSVVGALKLNLIPAAGHHGDQTILLSKGIQCPNRCRGQRYTRRYHLDQLCSRCITDPTQSDCHHCNTDIVQPLMSSVVIYFVLAQWRP